MRLALADAPAAEKSESQKKAAEEDAISQKFAAWKATLSPEQQDWETVLEQNLGNYPHYQREKMAGRESIFDYIKDDPRLPRVLLIGDSVSGGYTRTVRKELEGIANVHCAPENCGPTSTGIKKLDIWLGDGHWDVIHFNFGLHETRTPVNEYRERLDTIAARLQTSGAKIIWASTTPIPDNWKPRPGISDKIIELNAAAAEIMQNRQIPIDDLYTFILPQLKETQIPEDIHFNQTGCTLLGQQAAATIKSQLKKR